MSLLFILILGCCGGILAQDPSPTPSKAPICSDIADIVFVLDSSGSIGEGDYKIQLDFVAKLTQAFELGPKKIQFGAIDFSSTSQIQFHLKDYTDHKSLESAIKRAPKLSSGTAIELALDMARTVMFTPENGGRKDATRIVIVITDGSPSSPDLAHIAYKKLKNAGILVVAIGIGVVHLNELNLLATSPDEVFKVDSYSVLHHIQDEVINKTCELPKVCLHKADIIFILDSSTSIEFYGGNEDYIRELKFASDLTKKFDLKLVQFGVVLFATRAQKLFDLNAYSDHANMSTAIMKAPYLSGATHTDRALNLAQNVMFDPKNGGRVNTTKIIVILTEGQPQDPYTAADVAKVVRSKGIHIIAIGVGPEVEESQLKDMANTEKDVFLVSGFDALHHVEEIVAKTACAAGES